MLPHLSAFFFEIFKWYQDITVKAQKFLGTAVLVLVFLLKREYLSYAMTHALVNYVFAILTTKN